MKERCLKAGSGSPGPKSANLLIRLQPTEKQSFKAAADLAGQALSVWVRDRLRHAAKRELEDARKPVTFLPDE